MKLSKSALPGLARTPYTLWQWSLFVVFAGLVAFFALYVKAEKAVDRANEARYQALVLAHELRQSSDDLTRMVRSYVATGEPRFKQYYEAILAIRDGIAPRPLGYEGVYWDFVLDGRVGASVETPQPLLERMRRAGFTQAELDLLEVAKGNSDQLALIELQAMTLIESAGAGRSLQRERATALLHDAAYHRAKAQIMAPIQQFIGLSDARTRRAVEAATEQAFRLRLLFLVAAILLLALLVRLRQGRRQLLGAPIEEVYAQITRLGGGDLTTPIPVARGAEATVLGRIEAARVQLWRAGEDLRAREAQLRSVFENAGDAIYIHDRRGQILDVNPLACAQTGYTREELLAINVTALDSSASEEGLFQLWSAGQVEPGKFPITLVSSHRRKNGSTFPIEIRISLLQGRDENLFIAVVRDISDRQAAELQLADQAQHTQSILDNMVDGVITIDARGIIQSFSKAAERIFGYASSEVIGCNVNMLMPSPHRESHDAYLRNYQTGGQARIIGIGREVEGLRKDGSLFPLDLAVSQTSHRGQTMYVGVVRDITERKRLDRMKSEFVSTVSHELRTPLTAIRGALGLIMGGAVGVMPQQAEAMLKIASNNTERLLLLINDILDMQKIESGQLVFAFETLEVTPFLRRVLEDLKSYGEQHQVRFVLTQELAGARVFADAARLTQVMANLLSNAAKFSPPGAQVEVALSRQDRFLRIAVIDHGAGIPAEFQSRLFTRFSQADSSDTRSKGGTGLGLAITKAIVEKHGGHIAYAATAGQGSTFYVDLPLLGN